MDLVPRRVIVKELPAVSESKRDRAFVKELANSIANVIRPCIVLDCARVRRVDGEFLHLLLCCLEEAMKRNGDVRLAGFPEAARPAMQSLGMERLFRFFATPAEAADSFRRPAPPATVFPPAQGSVGQRSARAA